MVVSRVDYGPVEVAAARSVLIELVHLLGEYRDDIVRSMGKALLWPMLAGLPLLGVALWVGIGRGLRPIAPSKILDTIPSCSYF